MIWVEVVVENRENRENQGSLRDLKNQGNLGNIENKFIGCCVSNLKTYCLYLILNEF